MRPYLKHLYSSSPNKKSSSNNKSNEKINTPPPSNSLSIVSSKNSPKKVVIIEEEKSTSTAIDAVDHKLIKPSSFRIKKGIIQDSNREDFLRIHFDKFREGQQPIVSETTPSETNSLTRTKSSPNMEKSNQEKTEKRNHHHNQHRNSLSHKKTIRPLQPQDEDKLDLPSCIMNSLYLGDCFQATNKKSIDHFKITHIINCTKNVENKFERNHEIRNHSLLEHVKSIDLDVSEINLEDECVKHMENAKLQDDRQVKYLRIPIDDVETENIYQYFNQAHSFIEDAMFDCGIVLVHCAAGVSRSSSIVISYVMKKMGVPFMFAFNMVKRRRRMIMPNEGFFEQLLEWERILNGGKSISQFKDGYMDLLEIEHQMYSSY